MSKKPISSLRTLTFIFDLFRKLIAASSASISTYFVTVPSAPRPTLFPKFRKSVDVAFLIFLATVSAVLRASYFISSSINITPNFYYS